MNEDTKLGFDATTDAIANVLGRLTATELIQNAIATHLRQTDPSAAEAIARYLQIQYDTLPAATAGAMNNGLQARLADFRQALALPGNLRE